MPSGASFEDSMQNHPSDDPEQGNSNIIWYNSSPTYEGTINIIHSGPTYNKALRLRSDYLSFPVVDPGQAYNLYPSSSGYISFINRYKYVYPDFYPYYTKGAAEINFYDKDGFLLDSIDIQSYADVYFNDSFELVRSSNNIYLYINGIQKGGSLGTLTSDPSYFEFGTYWTSGSSFSYSLWDIDCVSTDGYVIGIGTEESPDTWVNTASNNEIDVEWTVKTIDPFGVWNDTEIYQIRCTWMDADTIVNTTTLNTTKPSGFVVYNRSTLMPIPNYGIYKFDLLKDSIVMETDYLTFLPIGQSGTLSWDKTDYVTYQNATITYAVAPFEPADYNYYIRTYEINTGLVDTNTITVNSGTITESLDAWATGSYYSLLVVVDKSDGTEYTVAFDVFDINDEVRFEGYTYDAENGTILNETNVNFSQSTSWYNDTSNAIAFYELEGLSDGVQVTLNASKTNFTHEEFIFIPPVASLYTTNLYLFQTNITRTTSAVHGMVQNYPLHQGISEATVNIYNDTWSNTTTATSWGYYVFDNLSVDNSTMTNETFNSSVYDTWVTLNNTDLLSGTILVSNLTDENPFILSSDYEMNYTDGSIKVLSAGNMTNWTDYHIDYNYYIPTTYHVNATKDGYDNSTEYDVIVTNRTWTIQNIILPRDYYLTVTAKDSTTQALLSTFTAIVDGESISTANGSAVFSLSYGLYSASVSADNYYPGAYSNALMNQNRSVEVSMTQITTDYYDPKHNVKFTVQNIWGTKYSGVDISIYIGTATDVSFEGTTGSDGSATFELNETTSYRITFINATAGIDKEITIYPVDTHYIIYVSTVDLGIPDTTGDDVSYYWATERINSTHAYINFTWTDTSGSSTDFTYWVNDSDGNPLTGFPVSTTTGNFTNSTIVAASSDRYTAHVIADHPIWGEVEASENIFFGGRMIELGWSEDWHYSTVAFCAIIFIGLLAGAVTAHYMAVICVMVAWFFKWIGWLDNSSTSTLLLILCTVVAFGFAMRKGEVVKV